MSFYEQSLEIQAGGSALLPALLKCHNCREGYAKPPINLCKRDHLLCPECVVSRHCFCGKTFRKKRSVELEAMAKLLLKSCRWGCEKWMPPDEVEVHEKHCDFKKLSCASLVGDGDCDWTGIRKEWTHHLLSKHSLIISDGFMHDIVIENYSQVENFSATCLLTCFGHLFLVKLVYSDKEKVFRGRVHFVSGAPHITKEFRYEFEIGKQTKNDAAHYKLIFSRQTHRISEDYSDHICSDKCDCFCFAKNIGAFFTDSRDKLTVTVIMKSVQSLAMKNAQVLTTYGFEPSQYCQNCVRLFNPVPLL